MSIYRVKYGKEDLNSSGNNHIIERVLKILIDARRVYCYGVGRFGPLVREAEHCFARASLHCIGIEDEAQMAIQSSHLTSEDVVLAFSRAARNCPTVGRVALARKSGATFIGVTARAGEVSDISLTLFEDNTQSGGATARRSLRWRAV